MFAVIKTGGKQYKVTKDSVILVEKLAGEAGDAVSFEEVLMVGKSQIVGLPLAVMLMKAGATVTVAHSRTKDLAGMIKNYKIVIVAIGKPELVKAEWFTEGQIIVDAGYNEGNIGDVDHMAYEKASFYTPVPGGVGPMTIASLMSQTAEAIDNMNNK